MVSCSAEDKMKRRPRLTFEDYEIQNLIEGVERFRDSPQRWRNILLNYAFHPRRTSVDLKDKWRNIVRLDPNRQPTAKKVFGHKKIPWSSAEIEALKQGHKELGSEKNPWASILKKFKDKFHPVRTSVHLKDKWRNITRAASRKDGSSQDDEDDEDEDDFMDETEDDPTLSEEQHPNVNPPTHPLSKERSIAIPSGTNREEKEEDSTSADVSGGNQPSAMEVDESDAIEDGKTLSSSSDNAEKEKKAREGPEETLSLQSSKRRRIDDGAEAVVHMEVEEEESKESDESALAVGHSSERAIEDGKVPSPTKESGKQKQGMPVRDQSLELSEAEKMSARVLGELSRVSKSDVSVQNKNDHEAKETEIKLPKPFSGLNDPYEPDFPENNYADEQVEYVEEMVDDEIVEDENRVLIQEEVEDTTDADGNVTGRRIIQIYRTINENGEEAEEIHVRQVPLEEVDDMDNENDHLEGERVVYVEEHVDEHGVVHQKFIEESAATEVRHLEGETVEEIEEHLVVGDEGELHHSETGQEGDMEMVEETVIEEHTESTNHGVEDSAQVEEVHEEVDEHHDEEIEHHHEEVEHHIEEEDDGHQEEIVEVVQEGDEEMEEGEEIVEYIEHEGDEGDHDMEHEEIIEEVIVHEEQAHDDDGEEHVIEAHKAVDEAYNHDENEEVEEHIHEEGEHEGDDVHEHEEVEYHEIVEGDVGDGEHEEIHEVHEVIHDGDHEYEEGEVVTYVVEEVVEGEDGEEFVHEEVVHEDGEVHEEIVHEGDEEEEVHEDIVHEEDEEVEVHEEFIHEEDEDGELHEEIVHEEDGAEGEIHEVIVHEEDNEDVVHEEEVVHDEGEEVVHEEVMEEVMEDEDMQHEQVEEIIHEEEEVHEEGEDGMHDEDLVHEEVEEVHQDVAESQGESEVVLHEGEEEVIYRGGASVTGSDANDGPLKASFDGNRENCKEKEGGFDAREDTTFRKAVDGENVRETSVDASFNLSSEKLSDRLNVPEHHEESAGGEGEDGPLKGQLDGGNQTVESLADSAGVNGKAKDNRKNDLEETREGESVTQLQGSDSERKEGHDDDEVQPLSVEV